MDTETAGAELRHNVVMFQRACGVRVKMVQWVDVSTKRDDDIQSAYRIQSAYDIELFGSLKSKREKRRFDDETVRLCNLLSFDPNGTDTA